MKNIVQAPIPVLIIILMLLSGISVVGYSQSFQETMEQLSEDAATEYVDPLVSAFGANLNTGWMNKAPDAEIMGIDLKLGLVFMGAFIDESKQSFLVSGIYRFQKDEATELAEKIDGLDPADESDAIDKIVETGITTTISGPTIFGSENDHVKITTSETEINVNGTTYTIDAGETIELEDVTGLIEDPGIVPTVAPQIGIGTFYGTQAVFRFLPNIKLSDEIGKLKYFGFGIQHNPGVWLANPLPVDVSAGFFKQSLKIGDIFEASTTAFGLNASKTFSGVVISATPYAGFLIEKSTVDITYTYILDPNIDPIEVNFELEGENKNRIILGVGLNVFGLNMFADYNFSKVNTVNLSLMYGF